MQPTLLQSFQKKLPFSAKSSFTSCTYKCSRIFFDYILVCWSYENVKNFLALLNLTKSVIVVHPTVQLVTKWIERNIRIKKFVRQISQDSLGIIKKFMKCSWYGSGSADPCLWLMDPDPDPAMFVIDIQDGNKKLISKKFFCLLLLEEGTFTSFFKDKKS